MTLQEIKDEYARGQGYEDWEELMKLYYPSRRHFSKHYENICRLYATACIKADREIVAENAEISVWKETSVDKQSILNTPIELL